MRSSRNGRWIVSDRVGRQIQAPSRPVPTSFRVESGRCAAVQAAARLVEQGVLSVGRLEGDGLRELPGDVDRLGHRVRLGKALLAQNGDDADQPNQSGGAEYGNDDLTFDTHSGVPAANRSLYHRSTGIRIYRPSNRVKTPLVMPGFVSRKTLVYSLAALTRRSTTGCR